MWTSPRMADHCPIAAKFHTPLGGAGGGQGRMATVKVEATLRLAG